MATKWKPLCVIVSIKLLRHILCFVVTGRSIDWSDQETEVRFLFCYILIFLFFSQFIAQNEFLQGQSSQRPLRLRLQNSKISIDRRNGECTRDPLDLLTSPAPEYCRSAFPCLAKRVRFAQLEPTGHLSRDDECLRSIDLVTSPRCPRGLLM